MQILCRPKIGVSNKNVLRQKLILFIAAEVERLGIPPRCVLSPSEAAPGEGFVDPAGVTPNIVQAAELAAAGGHAELQKD